MFVRQFSSMILSLCNGEKLHGFVFAYCDRFPSTPADNRRMLVCDRAAVAKRPGQFSNSCLSDCQHPSQGEFVFLTSTIGWAKGSIMGTNMSRMFFAESHAFTATGKFNAEAIAIQDRCSFDLARQRRSERDFREEKEAIIWQFFCRHKCIAAPTNRCIFAPVFTSLDFSARSSLLPRSRRLDRLCAAATWCHPPHVTATHEKKARKKSRAFVTSVEGWA